MSKSNCNEALSRALLRYGDIVADVSTVEADHAERRIRCILYKGHVYFHHMLNGELIEVYMLL